MSIWPNDALTPGASRRNSLWVSRLRSCATVITFLAVATAIPHAFIALHLILVIRKSLLEERYLLAQLGQTYRAYQERTGMFWPAFGRHG